MAQDKTPTTAAVIGDRNVHGTGTTVGKAKSKEAGEWTFTYYNPKDHAELVSLVGKHGDVYLSLVRDALETRARAASWGKHRVDNTSTVTLEDGSTAKVSKKVEALLKAKGLVK